MVAGRTEDVGPQVANDGDVTFELPQDQVIRLSGGVDDGDSPYPARPDKAAAHARVIRIGLDTVQPLIDAVCQGRLGVKEPDQFIVGFGVHFQHHCHNTPLPQ